MKTSVFLIWAVSIFLISSQPETASKILDDQKMAQVGIIVSDIDRAAEEWAAILGIDKPDIMESGHRESRPTVYHGEPTDATIKMAFIQLENIQLELMQPTGGESHWQDFLDTHGQGLHHIAFWVNDIEGKENKFEMQNMPVEQRGGWDSGGYSYIDTREKLGCYLELLVDYSK